METILSPHSFTPLFTNTKTLSSQSYKPNKSNSLYFSNPISCSIKNDPFKSLATPTSLFSSLQNGLAALAISLALGFSPVLPSLASEFDVLNDGPPKETYVVDDAGVLNRVTKSDLKRLLSDLESRKNFRINFITVRKLTVSLVFCEILLKMFELNVDIEVACYTYNVQKWK